MLLMLAGNIDIFYNLAEIREFIINLRFIGWILVLIIEFHFKSLRCWGVSNYLT